MKWNILEKKALRRASALLAAALPLAAAAHPGHDTAPAMGWLDALEHLLTQPDHLAALGLALVLAALALGAWHGERAKD